VSLASTLAELAAGAIAGLLAARERAGAEERAELDRLLGEIQRGLDAGAVERADADLARRKERG